MTGGREYPPVAALDGFGPPRQGVKVPCLTAWLQRHVSAATKTAEERRKKNEKKAAFFPKKAGGRWRDRTSDSRINSPSLCQLS